MIKFSEAQLEVWLDQNLEVRNWGKTGEVNCVCPFHQTSDTKRPDLWVNTQKGVYHCLSSSCGMRGTVVDLVMRLTGGSLAEARRELGRPGGEALTRLLGALRPQPAPTLSLTWDLIYSYRSSTYWRDVRGLEERTIDHFHLGFDHERNDALIPFFSAEKDPLCFIRRQLDRHPKYLYPANFPNETAIYHLYEAQTNRPLVVVEGASDAHRVWEAGFQNVVALMGSEVPPQKARLLKHFKLVAFMDDDQAGWTSTLKLKQQVGRIIHRVVYPESLRGQSLDPGRLTDEQIHQCMDRLKVMI